MLGIGLSALGLIAYAFQVWLQQLTAPWYLPLVTTLGVVLVVLSLWRKRTVWRFVALTLFLLVAGAAWMFVLVTQLPPYTGPVALGQPFPAFATAHSDGHPFTQDDLQGDQNSVLVFFRGRW